jgi:transposase
MNSQLRHIKDTIRPLATGEVGAAMDILLELCAAYQAELSAQEARISQLEETTKRHSGNSSMPPSSDKPWRSPKKRSLREKTDKAKGGQPGHQGRGGKLSDTPDDIVEFSASCCPHCTHDLREVAISETQIKQLVDIPPIKPVVTQYELHTKCCPNCNARVKADASACPIYHQMEFGPRLKAFCVYLSSYQLLPCQRTTELLWGVLGTSVSTGSLDNFRKLAARLLLPFEGELKKTIQAAAAAFFDETGLRVDGERLWGHTAATSDHTYYGLDHRRGVAAHGRMQVLPNFKGIAHHDALAAYDTFGEATHSLCNAHVLRELNGVIDREKKPTHSQFAVELKTLLKAIKQEVDNTKRRKLSIRVAQRHRKQYDKILLTGLKLHPARPRPPTQKQGRVKQTQTHNLLQRMLKRRDDYLRFMTHKDASFDNNQAERDLRMIKGKMKISGCFRSLEAGQEFLRIRSYVSTAIKQGFDPVEKIMDLFCRRDDAVMALAQIP